MTPALAGDLVEGAVGLPYLPGGSDHAAVFVGVGVAEHDFLLVVPGFEQRLVGGGGPEGAHDGGAIAEVFDGFEERDGLQAGVGVVGIGGAFDADSPEAGEPDNVEDVFGGGGATDDVAREGFGHEGALEFGDGAEGREDFGGLRSEGGGRVRLSGEDSGTSEEIRGFFAPLRMTPPT